MNKQKENDTKTLAKTFTDNDKEFIEKVMHTMAANISEYISEVKKSGYLTTREIGRRTGVSIAVISDIEHNHYLPKIEVLLKLAYGLNRDFGKVLSYMWDMETAKEWSIKANVPLPHDTIDPINNTNEMTLEKMLARKGLSKNSIQDIINFIDYKLMRQKKK